MIQRALRSLRSGIAALRQARLVPMTGAFVASMLHVSLRLAVLPIIALAMNPSLPLGKLVLWPLVFLYGGAVAPAPGGGGAVEFGFKLAFSGVMTPSVLGGTLVWWRFYTFYLYVVLGALAAGRTVMRALRDESRIVQLDPAVMGAERRSQGCGHGTRTALRAPCTAASVSPRNVKRSSRRLSASAAASSRIVRDAESPGSSCSKHEGRSRVSFPWPRARAAGEPAATDGGGAGAARGGSPAGTARRASRDAATPWSRAGTFTLLNQVLCLIHSFCDRPFRPERRAGDPRRHRIAAGRHRVAVACFARRRRRRRFQRPGGGGQFRRAVAQHDGRSGHERQRGRRAPPPPARRVPDASPPGRDARITCAGTRSSAPTIRLLAASSPRASAAAADHAGSAATSASTRAASAASSSPSSHA